MHRVCKEKNKTSDKHSPIIYSYKDTNMISSLYTIQHF